MSIVGDRRMIIRRLIHLSVSAVLISALLYFVDIDSLLIALSTVTLSPLLAAFALTSMTLFINGFRWAILVRASGFPHSLKTLILIRLVAQGLNVFLPGGVVGDGLQVFMITRKSSVSAARALTTILIDRLIALFVILTVLALTLGTAFPDMLKPRSVVLTMIVCFFVISGSVYTLLKFQIRLVKLKGFAGKLMAFALRSAKEVAKTFKKPVVFTKCSILSLVGHFLSIGVLWNLVNVYNEVPFSFMIPLISMVVFVTLIPFTFMGMGVREAALFTGLQQYGFSLEEAVAVSLIWLAISLFCSAIFAGIAIVLSPEPVAIQKIIKRFWPTSTRVKQ
jgi:glycosyltransferase 2 family protein